MVVSAKRTALFYDLSIDEVEGPIVKEVFDLIIHEGYGTLRAANYLNDKYASLGKIWTAQTIRSMLRNVIYTGRMHMNDTISAPNEALRIISDEDLEFAKYALSARIPRKYHSQRKAEDEALPEDAQTKTSVYGATLLSGLLYCALRSQAGRRLLHKAAQQSCLPSSHLSLLQRFGQSQRLRWAIGIFCHEDRSGRS